MIHLGNYLITGGASSLEEINALLSSVLSFFIVFLPPTLPKFMIGSHGKPKSVFAAENSMDSLAVSSRRTRFLAPSDPYQQLLYSVVRVEHSEIDGQDIIIIIISFNVLCKSKTIVKRLGL